jgi:hypothetical protein
MVMRCQDHTVAKEITLSKLCRETIIPGFLHMSSEKRFADSDKRHFG